MRSYHDLIGVPWALAMNFFFPLGSTFPAIIICPMKGLLLLTPLASMAVAEATGL